MSRMCSDFRHAHYGPAKVIQGAMERSWQPLIDSTLTGPPRHAFSTFHQQPGPNSWGSLRYSGQPCCFAGARYSGPRDTHPDLLVEFAGRRLGAGLEWPGVVGAGWVGWVGLGARGVRMTRKPRTLALAKPRRDALYKLRVLDLCPACRGKLLHLEFTGSCDRSGKRRIPRSEKVRSPEIQLSRSAIPPNLRVGCMSAGESKTDAPSG